MTALCLGADAKSAAIVWGNILLILTVSSSRSILQESLACDKVAIPAGGETLKDMMHLLEKLSTSLPRFKAFEKTLPMDEAFELSLLAAYMEMTFFLRSCNQLLTQEPPL